MKKLLVSAIAVLLVAFSAVPAFAATVASPVATQPRVVSGTSTTKDSGSISPKTGSDSLPFAVIAVSAIGCASVAAVLAKRKAKEN